MYAAVPFATQALAPRPGLLLQSAPSLGPLIPIVLIMGIFYLLVIMPTRRRQKQLEQMLANLSTGDKVVTNGGVIGTIVALTDKTVTLRVRPDSVKLEFSRSAITGTAEGSKN